MCVGALEVKKSAVHTSTASRLLPWQLCQPAALSRWQPYARGIRMFRVGWWFTSGFPYSILKTTRPSSTFALCFGVFCSARQHRSLETSCSPLARNPLSGAPLACGYQAHAHEQFFSDPHLLNCQPRPRSGSLSSALQPKSLRRRNKLFRKTRKIYLLISSTSSAWFVSNGLAWGRRQPQRELAGFWSRGTNYPSEIRRLSSVHESG